MIISKKTFLRLSLPTKRMFTIEFLNLESFSSPYDLDWSVLTCTKKISLCKRIKPWCHWCPSDLLQLFPAFCLHCKMNFSDLRDEVSGLLSSRDRLSRTDFKFYWRGLLIDTIEQLDNCPNNGSQLKIYQSKHSNWSCQTTLNFHRNCFTTASWTILFWIVTSTDRSTEASSIGSPTFVDWWSTSRSVTRSSSFGLLEIVNC